MQSIELIHGEAMATMASLPAESFGALITDPPYSSGGLYAESRKQSTGSKYCKNPKNVDFTGDARDQRSWTRWTAEWLREASRLLKPGSPFVLFCDWRQYPALTDALQWADLVWRGVAVWDKRNSRPQPGRFRQQAEFIIWGSKGPMPIDRPVPVLPGVYVEAPVPTVRRLHQTEKPLELMRSIVKICVPGERILDPFAGSGTTLEAARLEGYDATGIELHEVYYKTARDRLAVGCETP